MTKHRLIVIGPLPPPLHGVTISTSLVLANPLLHERFVVEHLDTSDHRSGGNIGSWDARNVFAALSALSRLVRMLRGRSGLVYLPLSQSTPGFLRDSLLILVSDLARWRVTAHLRGSEFRQFVESAPPLWRRWIRSSLGRLDSVAVMGESLRWVFSGLLPEQRVAVVPNGTPEPRTNGVPRDPHHVVFLSNLRRRKGVVESVRAALLVLERGSSARFTFVGDWENPQLEAQLRSLAGERNGAIEFRGPVDGEEKDALLASAAVLLFPPVEPEGHPRVVLEALAAGVPVVTTDRGAIAETVVDGECGFVLADPDPERLAECILTLTSDAVASGRFHAAARARYLSRYTQDHADHALAEWLTGLT